MELLLNRKTKTENSTIGDLFINGNFFCYVLEDKDRGLNSAMNVDEIAAKKVYGKTAIPTGRYEVVMTYSDRFQKVLPLLIGVKGFDGIRIHAGNTSADTLGCLLCGKTKDADFVGNSREVVEQLIKILKAAMKLEKVFITIK